MWSTKQNEYNKLYNSKNYAKMSEKCIILTTTNAVLYSNLSPAQQFY